MNPGNKNPARKAPKLAGSDVKLDGADYAHDDDDDDDDDDRLAGSMMEVVCVHQGVVRFNIDGSRHKMRYGDVEKIPTAYATPVQFRPQGDPLPSVIERETGKKVLPVVDPRVIKDPKDGIPIVVKEKLAREAAKNKAAPVQAPGV